MSTDQEDKIVQEGRGSILSYFKKKPSLPVTSECKEKCKPSCSKELRNGKGQDYVEKQAGGSKCEEVEVIANHVNVKSKEEAVPTDLRDDDDTLNTASIKEGHEVSIKEGNNTSIKEGNKASIKEGHKVSIKEGNITSIKEGNKISINEGLQNGEVSPTVNRKEVLSEESSSVEMPSEALKLPSKVGDCDVKRKNVFAFMMASRDRQMEVVEENENEQNCQGEDVQINKQQDQSPLDPKSCETNKQQEQSPLDLKSCKTIKEKVSLSSKAKTGNKPIANLKDDDENKEKGKDKSVITKVENTPMIESDICEVGNIQKDTSETESDCIVLSNDIKTNNSDIEIHLIQGDACKSKSGSQKTITPSLGNAFTLLMTNRHKFNKVSPLEKESELCDDSTAIQDTKQDKHTSKRQKNGRKRKNSSSSQDADSSLLDFEVEPKEKTNKRKAPANKRRKKKKARRNYSSSEDEMSWSETSVDDKPSINLSSDDAEVDISNKDMDDQESRIFPADTKGIEKADEHDEKETEPANKEKISNRNNSDVERNDPDCQIKHEGKSTGNCHDTQGDGYCIDKIGTERKSEAAEKLVDVSLKIKPNEQNQIKDEKLEDKADEKKEDLTFSQTESVTCGDSSCAIDIEEKTEGTPLRMQLRRVRKMKLPDGTIAIGSERLTTSWRSPKKTPQKTVGELDESGNDNQKDGDEFRESLRKKRRKINYIDSDDSNSEVNDKQKCLSEEKKRKNTEKDENDFFEPIRNINISSFFKKISKEEKAIERSKTTITIKADVHAPYEGLVSGTTKNEADDLSLISRNSVSQRKASNLRRSSRKMKTQLEDFEKIELLEQILIQSPKKVPSGKQSAEKPENAKVKTEVNDVARCNVMVKESVSETLKGVEKSQVKNLNDVLGKGGNPGKKLKKPNVSNKKSKAEANSSNEKSVVEESIPEGVKHETKNPGVKKQKKQVKVSVNKIKGKRNDLGSMKNKKMKKGLTKGKKINSSKDESQEFALECSGGSTNTKKVKNNLSKGKGKKKKSSKVDSQKLVLECSEDNLPTDENSIENSTKETDSSLDEIFMKPSTKPLGNSKSKKRSKSTSHDKLSGCELSVDDKENVRQRRSCKKLSSKVEESLPNRTGQSLLLCQDNIKNQMQSVKTQKLNGKVKKKILKGKKKKLSLTKNKLLALQDGAIAEMAKANIIQVNTLMVDVEVADLEEDNSEGRIVNSSAKKRKIPPLVLKTPVEKKPLKSKMKKKMKNNLEIDDKKSKKKVTGESSRQTSRQAAMNAKKVFVQQQLDEEDPDIAIMDIDTSEDEKPLKKTKAIKVEKGKQQDSSKKATKLAPIFCKKAASPEIEILEVTLSPAKQKARQDFLLSGVPEQIKKQQLMEKSQEDILCNLVPFPKVNHVQQKDDKNHIWNSENCPILPSLKYDDDDKVPAPQGSIYQQSLFHSAKDLEGQLKLDENPLFDMASIVTILNVLKKNNPNFPIFTAFRFYMDLKREAIESHKRELSKEANCCIVLEEETQGTPHQRRKSKGSSKRTRRSKGKGKKKMSDETIVDVVKPPDPLPVWQERIPDMWTHVYAPKNSSQIIGNEGHIKRLKNWLHEWKEKTEYIAVREKSKKSKMLKKGDGFIVSDSDSDDDDFISTYLLCGPPGVGKTSAVYALAAELGYKVLEVNASSKRPGKQVMSRLAEATQSHSVSKTSNQSNSAIANMFAAKSSTPSKKEKKAILNIDESSQESTRDSEKRKGFSLVLFEDIDIVFEESDEGFLSTVNSFMTTTKRPIILTLSNPSSSALSKIKGKYEYLYFEPPPSDLIAQHLQLICLVNGQHICHDDLQDLVSVNHCDIRQSLLDIQMWSMAGSSLKQCECNASTYKDVAADTQVHCKDISITDVFPEGVVDAKEIELYRQCLWGKVHCRYKQASDEVAYEEGNQSLSSIITHRNSQQLLWSQIALNLPFFLPFDYNEWKIPKRYPLQPTDPAVKMTFLWQKYNWLSLDDEEDDSFKPTPKKEEEVEYKQEDKEEIPEYVKDSSAKCIESLSKLYNLYSQLDVLDSHHLLTLPGKQKRDFGWWSGHPTAGLSHLAGQYQFWSPHSVKSELVEDLSKRGVDCCYKENKEVLDSLPSRDWKQFSLPIQEDERPSLLESQPCALERNLLNQQSVNQHLLNNIPHVQQLTRKGYMDYLSFVRSTVRHDELCVIVNKSRRGKRFLSHTAQYGFDISSEEKIVLANSFSGQCEEK